MGVSCESSFFADQTIVLDGNSYLNCTFIRCRMIYAGGPLPTINGGVMEDCQFMFEGAAKRTLLFMRALYGAGLQNVVNDMLRSVVQGGGDGGQDSPQGK